MDFLTALTTLAPSIVAIATLIFAYLQNRDNNKRQLQQLREQQQHEEKKAQIESEATNERLAKERLQGVYADSTSHLSTLLTFRDVSKRNTSTYHDNLEEVQRALSLLTIYHYNKDGDEFNKFYKVYSDMLYNEINMDAVYSLRKMVIEFAINDPRLK